MSRIFLIGFMGSGKTTLGSQLAAAMSYEFIDLDHWIEKNEGATIRKIFDLRDENYFREKESSYLKSFEEISKIVLATGGGTPCFFDNMDWMNRNGITVYLKLSVEELFNHLRYERDHRPLVAGKTDDELKEFIRMKLNEREPYYLLANHIIQHSERMLEDLISIF